jgi:hypothetical protein
LKIVRIISAVFIVLGLATLAAAISEYRERAAFADNASAVTGEVTKLTQRTRSGRKGTSTYYTFTVRFVTPRGDTVEAEAMDSSSSPLYAEGERVPILFSRTKFSDFTFDHFTMLWGDAVMFAVVAGGFLGAGVSAFWIAGGRRRSEARSEATLPEIVRAWRQGRLTRDSEFQGLLVAFAFAGFFLLTGTILFVLFAPWLVQAIVAGILVVIAFKAVRARRK